MTSLAPRGLGPLGDRQGWSGEGCQARHPRDSAWGALWWWPQGVRLTGEQAPWSRLLPLSAPLSPPFIPSSPNALGIFLGFKLNSLTSQAAFPHQGRPVLTTPSPTGPPWWLELCAHSQHRLVSHVVMVRRRVAGV